MCRTFFLLEKVSCMMKIPFSITLFYLSFPRKKKWQFDCFWKKIILIYDLFLYRIYFLGSYELNLKEITSESVKFVLQKPLYTKMDHIELRCQVNLLLQVSCTFLRQYVLKHKFSAVLFPNNFGIHILASTVHSK